MALSDKVKTLLEDFVDSQAIKSVETFSTGTDNNEACVNSIASMFGFSGNFCKTQSENESKLVQSFMHNLQLLIQKTWVEKSDIALKEQILYKLEVLCNDTSDWIKVYTEFLSIIGNAVYLMFGQQTKSDDFCEYSLRIDPEFGIFWWYIQSLPATAEWPADKCRNAVLLGMYFLANY